MRGEYQRLRKEMQWRSKAKEKKAASICISCGVWRLETIWREKSKARGVPLSLDMKYVVDLTRSNLE
jgi:hypothetical protein